MRPGLGVDLAAGTVTRHVRRLVMFAAVAAAAVCSGVPTGVGGAAAATHPVAGGARVAASGGRWGKAEEVPGTAALNVGGAAEVISVSCASAGHCSAGGDYQDGSVTVQSFVVNEVNGRWGTAEELPGSAALSGGAGTRIYSLSCASAGNCGAGGYYVYYSAAPILTRLSWSARRTAAGAPRRRSPALQP